VGRAAAAGAAGLSLEDMAQMFEQAARRLRG